MRATMQTKLRYIYARAQVVIVSCFVWNFGQSLLVQFTVIAFRVPAAESIIIYYHEAASVLANYFGSHTCFHASVIALASLGSIVGNNFNCDC